LIKAHTNTMAMVERIRGWDHPCGTGTANEASSWTELIKF
jgi:hypothetical protein